MSRREPMEAGCSFLGLEETRLHAEGRLGPDRIADWTRHIDDGCAECRMLAADLESYADLLANGAVGREREEFGRREQMLRKRMVQEAGSGAGAARRRIPAGAMTAVAAVILFGVALFSFLNRDIRHPGEALTLPDGSTIAVQAMPFRPPPTLRGTVSKEEIWQAAEKAYARENYRKVEQVLTEVVDGPDEIDALLYRGIALYMLGDHEPGLELLDAAWVIAVQNDLPQGAILYYRGLTLLAAGQPDQARTALEASAAAGGRFAAEAQELAGRLAPE